MAVVAYLEIFLAIVSLFLIYQWSRNRNSKQQSKQHLIPNWPVIGMIPPAIRNSMQFNKYATKILVEAGGTFEFKGPWLSNMDFLCTADPDNAHHIFIKNFGNYHKGPEYRLRLAPFGEGILNSDGDQWRIHRKLVQAIFKDSKFQSHVEKTYADKIFNALLPVLDYGSKQNVLDLQDVFSRFTFDATAIMFLCHDPKTLTTKFPHYPFEKSLDVVSEAALRRHVFPTSIWKLQKWLQVGEERKLEKACKDFDEFLAKVVASKREILHKRQTQKVKEDDNEFDSLVAFLEDEQVTGLMSDKIDSNKVLRDAAFNFMSAGRDTVTAALSWLCWAVSMHPSVEKKIVEELKENFPGTLEGFFNAQVLDKLVYLHASINESLRLYPSVPYQTRSPLSPDVLPSGHHVDQNTRLFISYYTMGRMEKIWGADCLKFKPERWITSNGEIKHVPSYKFIAFGSGRRSCLGKDMAMPILKMVAAAVFWNYHFDILPGQNIIPSLSIMLHMKNGLKVKVSKTSP